MITLYPDYKDRFRCLAGACPDSCCKAWEIVVDPDTAAFYRTVPGTLGERLRADLAKDEEGDDYFPLVNGRCPFLNKDGLCDIHAALGEAATSAVCRQFPDFIEEYEGFTERCPSLACPAAAELIFAEPLTDAVYPAPPASGPWRRTCRRSPTTSIREMWRMISPPFPRTPPTWTGRRSSLNGWRT